MANTKITTNVIADNAVGITQLNVSDGSAGQFLKTDGSGTLSFATVSTTTALDDIATGDAAATLATSSGDITLDTPGDIILDADTGVWRFKDAGTTLFQIAKDGQSLVLYTGTSDGDMLFKGNDGGSTVTALTLDMSDAGSAYFNNKVGIGTSSPTRSLSISGTGAEYINIVGGTSSGVGLLLGDSDAEIRGALIYDNATDALGFRTGGNTERMRIDSSGNLSLGTTSHVNLSGSTVEFTIGTTGDTANDGGGISFAHNTSTLNGYLLGQKQSLSLATFSTTPILFLTNNTERMRIDSAGKLLIGDSASHVDDLLQIETPASGGGHGIQIRRNDSNGDQGIGRIMFGNNNDTDLATIQAITDGQADCARLVFSTQPTSGNSTERWRIDSAGRMTNGFDGSARSSFLQVAGNSISGGVVNFIDPDVSVATSNHILRCTFSVDTDSQGKFIAFYDGGGNIGSVSQNGAAAVSFNTTSDERLKENIVDASSQLNVVNNIQVREFDWKSSNKHDIGMIAQELNEVIPNVVQEGGDDVTEEPWVVDYAKLTPYLIKAIQEQQTIIDDLKSRIETLEG